MKHIFTLLFLAFLSGQAIAQTDGTVKAKLIDTIGKQSLKDASVKILGIKDSSLVAFGLAKDDGSFEIKNVPFGSYTLRISFYGYTTINQRVTISETVPVADLGTVYLQGEEHDLAGVTVTESPIKIKKDTVEYSASAFHTKPNANVEDLINKMPGMNVDKNGNVTHQGEAVQRALVNGKRYFGDSDPKMATKNLPPDVVDKIQVFDDLSDQAKFTGFDDGNRVKTINIITKKDKSTGYFGRAVAGAGTAGVYDENLNLHRMNGNQQLSLLAQGNDDNKQNFTPQDILGGGGGGGRGGGGRTITIGGGGGGSSTGPGITTTWAGGLNYRDVWGKNTDAYGSYFFNSQHVDVDQQSHQQALISDSSQFTDASQHSISRNVSHRINFNIESKLDTVNSIVFRPNITFQNSTPNASSTSSTTGTNGSPLYQSINNTSSNNTGYSINNSNFQFRHRFQKRGRTISLDMNVSASANNGDGLNYAVNSFFSPTTRIDTINQHYVDSFSSFSFNPTLSYTEPLGKNQMLELSYNYTYNHNNTINSTYDFNNGNHGFTNFDSLFSNSYKFSSNSNRVTLSYRIQNPKFNLSVGSGLQFLDFNSDNTTKNVIVARSYTNITPNAVFQYSFSRTKSLRIFYNGNTGTPSVAQLQPIPTTTDSINFQVGNPNLKPQFTHSFRLLYTNFDVVTQRVIFATINASTIVNDIQSSIVQTNTRKTSTYVNLDGTYNVNAYFSYGFPIKKIKSNLNFNTNATYSQSQSIVNGASDYTRNTNLGETIKLTTNLKTNFDMNFSSTTNYTIIRNTLQPTLNSDYYTQTFTADFTAYTNTGWLIASEFSYQFSGNHAPGYNTSVPLLNPSVAKLFGKTQAAEIRLTCFDALNQNQSVTRVASGNTITDSRTNVLTRYLLLTFTYNLRQFAGQTPNQKNPLQGAFPPGMRPPGGGRDGGMGNIMRGGPSGGFNP